MMKTLTTLTAAATIAAALTAAPSDAFAQRRWGPAVGLGILGGVAAGAIIGGAIANSYGPAYVVQPGYVPYGAYAGRTAGRLPRRLLGAHAGVRSLWQRRRLSRPPALLLPVIWSAPQV